MQKALEQLNVKLTEVVSDITGVTGLSIIQAILRGERDPVQLAQRRDPRCKESEATIARALQGTWRPEHLFALRQALALYEFYHQQLSAGDGAIEAQLRTFADRRGGPPLPYRPRRRKREANEPRFDARARRYGVCGVDLTAIEGIDETTALVLLSEIGTDRSRWPSLKHFASWLGLCPQHKIAGGKILRRRVRQGAGRAKQALRLAARSLHRVLPARVQNLIRRRRAKRGSGSRWGGGRAAQGEGWAAARLGGSGLRCDGLLSRRGLDAVAQRLQRLPGEEAHPVLVAPRRAPGDHFGRRQVALFQGLEDHVQTVLDVRGHQPFVAHFDLVAPLLHQLPCQPHGHWQLSRADPAAQVAFPFAVVFVVVGEVAVDVAPVQGGRVGDGLLRRGYPFVGSGRHVQPGGELAKDAAIRLRQLQQGIHQFRFRVPPERSAQRGHRLRSLAGGGCFLWLAWGQDLDSAGVSRRRRPRLVGQRFAVVPGHPPRGAGRDLVGVPLQLGQVVERVGLVQLAGVDQAQEQVADAGPVLRLVNQRMLAVQKDLLQGPLADVVVQQRLGLTQQQRQILHVPRQ